MRTLTVQTGPFSNWVGSHYWSSIEHDSGFPESSYSDLYNETFHGVFEPRLFLVDCVDSIGQINIPEPVLEEPEFEEKLPVHRYDRSVSLPLHPIRQAVLERVGKPQHLSQIPPPNFWTDIWELKDLPVFRQVLNQNLCPSETRYRYWFDFPEQTPEILDESPLRNLLEATDSSVHSVRIITDIDSAFCQYGMSCSDYLRTCYPKSRGLNLGCPQMPPLDHWGHDHALPFLVNLAKNFHQEKSLNESTRNIQSFVLPPDTCRDKLYQSGLAAVWLDSFTSVSELDEFIISSPYLMIDGKSMYSPLDPGSHTSTSRTRAYIKNVANPVDVSLDSEIFSGFFDQSSVRGLLEALPKTITRFQRDFRAAWEPFVENDEWTEIKDTIANLL